MPLCIKVFLRVLQATSSFSDLKISTVGLGDGFLPSDGTHMKWIDGFIPVPSVNLLAVSKDMQTNFIHQKQKISLSRKKKKVFFSPLEKCKYKTKYAAVHGQVMHSSAVCNLFSKRWSGSICEELGGNVSVHLEILWNILFPLLLLWNPQLSLGKKNPEDCK